MDRLLEIRSAADIEAPDRRVAHPTSSECFRRSRNHKDEGHLRKDRETQGGPARDHASRYTACDSPSTSTVGRARSPHF
jgi:hypothetical protein